MAIVVVTAEEPIILSACLGMGPEVTEEEEDGSASPE